MRLILIFMAACSLLLACGQEGSPPSAETTRLADRLAARASTSPPSEAPIRSSASPSRGEAAPEALTLPTSS